MQNDRMLSRSRASRLAGLLGWVMVPALVLSGCSDEGSGTEDPGDAARSGNGSSSEDEPYLPVPDGVELTAQGSELSVGDSATVAYEPRQGEVAALDLKVTKLERATFKLFVGWKLSKETKQTTPYFVHVSTKNVGDTDLGGKRVPLYGVDGNNKLLESSTFASVFKPCPSESFPKKFTTGDRFKTCLVYLAPDKGELTAASFRPTEEFNPIIWTGEVTAVGSGDEKGDKKGDGKKSDKQG